MPSTGTDSLAAKNITVVPLSDGFETGTFNTWPWQLSSAGGSQANWKVQQSVVQSGSFAAQSGAIGALSSSTLSVTLTVAAGELSFWRKVSSAFGNGLLTFEIDGSEVYQWSGSMPWQQSFYFVSAGQHTFSWTYAKGTGTPGGSDAAWLDGVTFTPGTTLTVNGSSASDQFTFSTSGTTAVVALDGESHSFAAGEFTSYVFNGDGGSATLTGSASGNSAKLYANGSGQLANTAAGYTVAVSGMSSIQVNGHTSDTVEFFDSPGNDTYYAYADYNDSGQPSAGMYGSTAAYSNSASGFGTNIGYSTAGGSDTAYYFDSPQSDTYYAYADYNNSGKPSAGMYGSYGGGYSNSANGFGTNVGYATAGGSDTAYLFDSPQNDTYYAYADYKNSGKPSAGMYGSYGGGYANSANGFGTNVGYATNGGSERPTSSIRRATTRTMPTRITTTAAAMAGMYGSYGGGYSNAASGFATNVGNATAGGSDTAYSMTRRRTTLLCLRGLQQQRQAVCRHVRQLRRRLFQLGHGFGTNVAYSTAGGSDTAYFYDSPQSDTFYAYANYNKAARRRPACTAATAAAIPTRPAASPRISDIQPMAAAIPPISSMRWARIRFTRIWRLPNFTAAITASKHQDSPSSMPAAPREVSTFPPRVRGP